MAELGEAKHFKNDVSASTAADHMLQEEQGIKIKITNPIVSVQYIARLTSLKDKRRHTRSWEIVPSLKKKVIGHYK